MQRYHPTQLPHPVGDNVGLDDALMQGSRFEDSAGGACAEATSSSCSHIRWPSDSAQDWDWGQLAGRG